MTRPGEGVVVPAELASDLAKLAVIGARTIQRDSGGLPLVPGMASLIAELATSASGPAPRSVGHTAIHPAWVSVGQAAGMTGHSARHIRRLARGGRLIACKVGRDWRIDAQSAGDYARERKVA